MSTDGKNDGDFVLSESLPAEWRSPTQFVLHCGLEIDVDGEIITVRLKSKQDVEQLRSTLLELGNPWRGYTIHPTLAELDAIEAGMNSNSPNLGPIIHG